MSEEDARVERYLREHNIEAVLADAVLDAVLAGSATPLRHIAGYLGRIADGSAGSMGGPRRLLKTATWNIAAINNNPFEYWITHDDPAYDALMSGVQDFISASGARDVPVSDVFPPERFAALKGLMAAQGWAGLEQVEEYWRSDLSARPIVAGFMKDKSLGEKRLASMPDRVTNSIGTAGGGRVFRPSVISCYSGDLSSQQGWWEAWVAFMFATNIVLPGRKTADPSRTAVPAELLGPIQRAKYPALSEAEEAISVPLQTLCAAVFDAILVHIVNSVSPTGSWQAIKASMLSSLYEKKTSRTLAVLARGEHHAAFVQEAAAAFPAAAAAADSPLAASHFVLAPAAASKSDQNSLLVLAHAAFDQATAAELSDQAMALCPTADAPVSPGDLLVVSVSATRGGPADWSTAPDAPTRYLLASFHGDTNGLASLPVLRAVHALAQSLPDARLLFGLDANTYVDGVPSKLQGVAEFASLYGSLGYASCWGAEPSAEHYTTFCARTFLQPQLQKACALEERTSKGDRNPKDFVLFSAGAWELEDVARDNTGEGRFVAEMVLPTLAFPSDHVLLAATLRPKQ